MRLVMMGTGPFAVPTFLSLLDSSHEVAALITRPPHGVRGRGPAPVNPMREAAEARGVPVFMPEDINTPESCELLAKLAAELMVVCDYGQILKQTTLSQTRLGGINLHGSLLPKYRGAAPVHWAVYNGDAETGVTVIHMTPKLDGGPILAVRRTPVDPEETTAELEPRLAQLGVEPVLESIEMLKNWNGENTIGERQDPALACKAPRLQKTDGALDWTRTARELKNQIRAFQPWPGCYTHWLGGKGGPLRLILNHVSVLPPSMLTTPLEKHPPGTVVFNDRNLWVATGYGLLSIDRLQPAGKRIMSADEFLRGHNLQIGDVLSPVG